MAHASLLNLSTEILISIAEQLCLHCSHGGLKNEEPSILHEQETCVRRMALSHLSMTCKKLRDIAQPILFHVLSLDNQLPHFVGTLIQRPDLAESIKQLVFDGVEQTDDGFSENDGIRFAEKAGMEIDTEDLPWEDEDKKIELLQLLILHLTPKLEHLILEVFFDLTYKKPLSKMLPYLHTFEARNDDREGGFDMSKVQGILKSAPNLKRFDAVMMTEAAEMEEPVCSDSVTEVTLHNSVVEGPYLKNLMRCFPKLEVFWYFSGDSSLNGFEFFPTPNEMSQALSIRRQTLKVVNINLGDWVPIDNPGECEAMSTLRSMEVLEELWLDNMCVLAGASADGKRITNLLPPCIRMFGLPNSDSELDQDILYLAEVAPYKFPALKTVKLSNICNERRNMFQSAFAKQGIKFVTNPEY